MSLKDQIAFGMALPHRSMQPIDRAEFQHVAQRAEALGFADLWVTENTLDHALCLDPTVALSFAAAHTQSIRLGVSVVVLPVHNPVHIANQFATLDYMSGGRAVLGVGIGRDQHYAEFQVPTERRVRRFLESIEVIRSLWTQTHTDFVGEIYSLHAAQMALKPLQTPTLPIWIGGIHPKAVRRAAKVADGWMGAGSQSIESFRDSVPILREALVEAGRDPAAYPISKRIFLAVDDKPAVAREAVHRWFSQVYKNPAQTDLCGVHGTAEQVREQLEAHIEMGANHLMLNPVWRFPEQLEMLAEIVGLR